MDNELDSDTRRRIEGLLGSIARVSGHVPGGYSPALRWIITDDRGRRAFVKIATTGGTAQWLRAEWSVYGALGAACMPELLGWDDDGVRPILVLEDLSGARWPPPWDTELVESVVAAVRDLHRIQGRLKPFSEVHGENTSGWVTVGRAPEVLAATGLISRPWIDRYGEERMQPQLDSNPVRSG